MLVIPTALLRYVSQTSVFDTSYAGYRAARRQVGSGRYGHGPCHPGIAVTRRMISGYFTSPNHRSPCASMSG
jgi:hypothetical protein